MLGEKAESGHADAPALSTLREILAKHIAARNPAIEPGLFSSTVNRVLFALAAARLLEAAGCSRGAGLDELLREQGLLKGLSSFFAISGKRCGSRRPGSPGTTPDDELSFRFAELDTDKKIVETVINLTSEVAFTSELKYSRDGTGAGEIASFLMRQVRLSPENRMVVKETAGAGIQSRFYLPPGTYIPGIAGRALERRLANRSPVSGGSQTILDPCCGTGLMLCEAFAFLLDWHLCWYNKHLVPVLREGKDPVSRSVQKIIPKPSRELATPGYSPLPVYRDEDGQYILSWYEKARILSESIFGVDSDSQAVMVTRLLLLSLFLDGMTYPGTDSFRQDIIFGILSRNVRSGNMLESEAGHGLDTFYESACSTGDGNKSTAGNEFSLIAREGGFDLVICQITGLAAGDGNDNRDSPAGTSRAGHLSQGPGAAIY